MKLKRSVLAISTFVAFSFGNNSFADSFNYGSVKANQPVAVSSRGDEPSMTMERRYLSGKSGMKELLVTIEEVLLKDAGQLSASDLDNLIAIRDHLLRTLSVLENEGNNALGAESGNSKESPMRASESGTICSVPYSLTAVGWPSNFWYINAQATAEFQQFDPLVGPRPPQIDVTLFTFARVVRDGNVTFTDSDSKVFGLIGTSSPGVYQSADPAFVTTGPRSSCMTADAQAAIMCGMDLRAVSDNFSMNCD